MQLERIAVRLRRRSPWEALDLGAAMWRAWGSPAYRAWVCSYWLTGLLLLALMPTHPEIVLAILWWLKPAFDRVLLHVYSRALFATPTHLSELIAAWRPLLLHSGLLHALTIGRFSAARSFLLPVRLLEGLSGKAARVRARLLLRKTEGVAHWLTLLCATASSVITLGFFLLLQMLAPGAGQTSLWAIFESLGEARAILVLSFVMLAETLIEPLYVASGLALYVNRRSELEGWDIELAFRRLQARLLEQESVGISRGVTILCIAAWLACGLGLAPGELHAEEEAPVVQRSELARRNIERILADPVFGGKKTEYRWQQIQAHEKQEPVDASWLSKLLKAFEFFGEMLRGLVWIGIALLAVFLVYFVVTRHAQWHVRAAEPTPPSRLFGLDVRPESLPDDVVAAARAAFAEGRIDAGLALLYRAALSRLVHAGRIAFRPGDTEGDCLRRVRGRVAAPTERYFGEILAARLTVSYAHRPPEVPVLMRLCDQWDEHFAELTEHS